MCVVSDDKISILRIFIDCVKRAKVLFAGLVALQASV